MRKIFLGMIAMIAMPLVSEAGTIRIVVTGPGLSYDATATVDDSALADITATLQKSGGQIDTGKKSGGEPVLRDLTSKEAVDIWWTDILQKLADTASERKRAAALAVVTPIIIPKPK